MADYARLAVDAGARIVGGCCGSRPEHVAAMRAALDGYAANGRPDRTAIESRIGPLVAPPNESGRVRERRGRRG
jgi:5-methyltetrahydrofolate--homocysteine methyltransferase